MQTKLNPVKKIIVMFFLLTIGVLACHKSVDPPPPTSTLTIIKFDTVSITSNSAKFTWKDSSNKTIESRTITNNNNSEVVNVFSLSSYEAKDLIPNTWYRFTYQVKDVTGKTASSSVSFWTKEKESSLVGFGEISYDKQFKIVGNAQSDTLRIKIKNLSSKSIVIPSLTADFGENSSAIKMLRYRFFKTRSWRQ